MNSGEYSSQCASVNLASKASITQFNTQRKMQKRQCAHKPTKNPVISVILPSRIQTPTEAPSSVERSKISINAKIFAFWGTYYRITATIYFILSERVAKG